MKVYVLGISGAIGRLLAADLVARGDVVRGLVRTRDQADELLRLGVACDVAALDELTAHELAAAFAGADAIVYSAGSNGGTIAATDAIDGVGVATASEAARIAGVQRFLLVSVLPESWRERTLEPELEHYFAAKKRAEVALVRTALDWIVLRPSMLTDEPASGTVALGPAEIHDDVARADVADVIARVLHEPAIRRTILELNRGEAEVADAVAAVVAEAG